MQSQKVKGNKEKMKPDRVAKQLFLLPFSVFFTL